MRLQVENWLRDRFSFSKLETFAKCPKRAFFKYVQKLKRPSEMVLGFLLAGRAIHGGQETDCYAKIRGEKLSIGQVLDSAVAVFEDEREKEGVSPKDAPTTPFAEEHQKQLEVFESSGARAELVPVAGSVEAPFEVHLEMPDAPAVIEGYTDVVSQNPDGTKQAVDFKSSRRALTPAAVHGHLQLGLEAIGAEASTARIVNFVAGERQRPTTKVLDTSVPQEKVDKTLAWVAETISDFRKALKSGDFPRCSAQCFWCSREACEYYEECYPARPKAPKVREVKPVGFAPAAEWRQSLAGRQESERKAKA